MRAAVNDRYGPPDVVRVIDVPKPQGDGLVRVVAAAVTSGDARIRAARFPDGFGAVARLAFGIRRPRTRILGSAFSGVVETAGAGFEVGDEVCGMTGTKMGAHAEFVVARTLVRKPASVSHDDAAGVLFGGTTALFFLREKATVGPGTTVLIVGASGAVGTNAVQLAKHFGAIVTAVTSNTALARSLGADHVIDHTSEETTGRYDVVLDCVGVLSASDAARLLTPDGVLLLAVASLRDTLRSRGQVRSGSAPERAADFEYLLDLVAAGALTVVVESVHPLDDIAAAHRRVDSGHKVGNIIVRP